VCVCVCMCLDNKFQTIIIDYLAWWFTLTLSMLHLQVKVMGQSSRSQEANVAKMIDMS